MTTMVELTQKARELNLKGYSKLKKPELEELVRKALREQENAQLAAIRSAPTSADAFPLSAIPGVPLVDVLSEESIPEDSIARIGLNNKQRAKRYLAQKPGRKKATVNQARRMRKNYRAGDFTLPFEAVFSGVVLTSFIR